MKSLSNALEKDLSKKFQTIFEVNRLDGLARKTRFVERSTSQISGHMFLKLNVLFDSNNKESSLNDMCDFLEDHFQVRIKKQSLDERFNQTGVAFMKECFYEVFSKTMHGGDLQCRNHFFSHIYLSDSTAFKLPSALKELYKGTGTASGLKIFYSFDLAQGTCTYLDYQAACVNDCDALPELEKEITKGALYIKDLGFWSGNNLEHIHQNGAYFVSRYKTGTNVFGREKNTDQLVHLQELLPLITSESYDCEGFIDTKSQIPIRVSIQKVPQEVALARIKKMKHKAATMKREISDRSILFAHYNIYLTNASEEQLPYEVIQSAYRLRWQIEQVFKAWKSILELEKLKTLNANRSESYLLGRILFIMLSTFTQNTFKQYLRNAEDFELSEWKTHKVFKKSQCSN